MTRWSEGHPSISLLLGNTLGNIEASNFLQVISRAMKPRDLLAVEIAIANDAILISRNLADFEQIPNLSAKDWTR